VTSDEPEKNKSIIHPPPTVPIGKPKVGSYSDLLVWQKAITLVKKTYQITGDFPRDERFGLTSQMRRAAVSIPSNIAEGQARKTTAEFVQFLSQAEGSAAELDTQFVLAVELGYCGRVDIASTVELISEVKKMLNGLRRALLKAA